MFKVSPAVKPRNQAKSSTCWLSCLEMMFEWKKDKGDTSKGPTQIPALTSASPDLPECYDYLYNNGLPPWECKMIAKALGLRWSGGGDIDINVLAGHLRDHGPSWIGGAWYLGRSHAILLTGADTDEGRIKYVNPFNNGSLTETNGTIGWLNDNRGPDWKTCDAGIMYWR